MRILRMLFLAVLAGCSSRSGVAALKLSGGSLQLEVDAARGTKQFTTSADGATWAWGPLRLHRGRSRVATETPSATSTPQTISINWGPTTETFTAEARGIEQAFVFQRAPEGEGPLRLSFAATEHVPQFHYSNATWVDAAGRRTALTPVFENGDLTLDVSADVLARTQWPATLDPMIEADFALDAAVPNCSPVLHQREPAVAFGAGLFWAVWEDERGGVWGTRVGLDGRPLDTSSVSISNHMRAPRIAVVGNTFLVIGIVGTSTDAAVGVVRLDPSGAVLDATPTSPPNRTVATNFVAVAARANDFVIAWADDHQVITVASVDTSAHIGNAQVISSQPQPLMSIGLGSDGVGALVAWSTAKNTSAARLDSSLTRVGDLSQISRPSGYDPIAVAYGAGQYLLGWEVSLVVYAARLNASTGVVADPQGQELGGGWHPSLVFDGTNFRASWNDFSKLHSALVTPLGTVQSPITLAIATGDWGCSTALSTDGTLLAAFTGQANATSDIFAVRIRNAAFVDASPLLVSIAANAQDTPAIGTDGTNFLVVWLDLREPGNNPDLYGARVSPSGSVLDATPIKIATSPRPDTSPAVAGGPNGFFVAWQDALTNGQTFTSVIRGVRVSSAGVVLDAVPLQFSPSDAESYAPSVGANGNAYLVAWQTVDFAVRAARVDATTGALGVVQTLRGVGASSPAVASIGGEFLVAWSDNRSTSGSGRDIYATRIDADGGVIDRDGGAPIHTGVSNQEQPAIASDGTNALITWRSNDSEHYSIGATRYSATADVLDVNGFVVAENERPDRLNAGFDATGYQIIWNRGSAVKGMEPEGLFGGEVQTDGTVRSPMGGAVATEGKNPALAFIGSRGLMAFVRRIDAPPFGSPRVRAAWVSSGYATLPAVDGGSPGPRADGGIVGGGAGADTDGGVGKTARPAGCESLSFRSPTWLALLSALLLARATRRRC